MLCIACLPVGLQVAAQEEEQSKCQYVVLKVINKEDDTKPIGVTLLRIGDASNHSFLKGRQGVLSDTCIIQESDNDELINNLCRSVEYGDIIEYRGEYLTSQTGTMYNYVGREENAVNDSFEKIGTVFDNPTSDVESKVVDGESVIAVHPADGSTYLIGRGATDNLFIELNCTAEEYNDETLAEEQETPIETLLEGDADGSGKIDILDVITLNKTILGKEELSETQLKAIDFNGNGKPDAEESLMLMKYVVGLVTSFTE